MRQIRFVSAPPQRAAARREGVTEQERERTIRRAFEIGKRQTSKGHAFTPFLVCLSFVLLEFGACTLD